MRPPNSPPASPLLSPERPQIDQDASLLSSPQPQIPDPTDLSDLDSPMTDLQWSPYAPTPTAHAGPGHAYGTQDGDDETSSADSNHDMLDVDVEEGGVPLNDFLMEENSSDPTNDPNYDPPPFDNGFFHQDTLPLVAPPSPPVVVESPLQPLDPIPPLPDIQDEEEIDPAITGLHPMALSNANPMSLGPENPHVMQFLDLWQWQSQTDIQPRASAPVPSSQQIRRLAVECPRRVEYKQLGGDSYDFQGISWEDLGVPRHLARRRRMTSFHNYVNRPNSDSWHNSSSDKRLRPLENYYRFKSMDIRRDVRLLHFQLRNILGVASRTRVFYPSFTSIREHDPTTGRDQTAIRFDNHTGGNISTLTANEDILIAGGFYGSYHYRHLNSASEEIETHEGQLTNHNSGITNHVQIHTSRHSNTPVAAFASNDFGFRTVDLATNKITSEIMYDFAMNCSALSPDKRLRAIVGDHQNLIITDAENGEILQSLEGHRDFGFACDWAPDGWTVATGNQDRSIRIWDARRWKNSKGESESIAVVRTQMAGARSLRFSPLGSGKRILVAAEEADFVNLIDAQTFNTRQTIDIFGELSGVGFANGGHDLIALSSDLSRGGVMRLERCDTGAEDTFDYAHKAAWEQTGGWWRTPGYDWKQSPEQIVGAEGSQKTLTQKRRQAAMLENWTF
ncbi:YVTN repeat-like/Quino protein amine dehydrogenase [Hypoxylon trugodes]|uniref:YVTN repeat-like/Quino protein amine dehydrogenase n=1 Tax=Hypoxylon trugodes TaxID=326681 RepID=UPI002194C33B|nr:YVTN repeat-like/Quino protein amine dehydrogenase [Hypoxylon trugodes]KAI1385066.1 YVTN repeat-like/Quino protein amine dehydrogenase [Hypoxylon trugodes]